MMKTVSTGSVLQARESVIDAIIQKHNHALLGTPPKLSPSGRLYGATPPNLELLQKLLK